MAFMVNKAATPSRLEVSCENHHFWPVLLKLDILFYSSLYCAFLGQFKVLRENRLFKALISQNITLSVRRDFIVFQTALLSNFKHQKKIVTSSSFSLKSAFLA